MAHYAKVCDGKVLKVIVADEDYINSFVDTEPGEWIQTSCNTRGGVHILDGTPFALLPTNVELLSLCVW